jgi:hypothetical protein
MKKIDLGQTVSILANVGVIAGIVFLGYELRQNNEQLAAQTRFNYYQERSGAAMNLALNSDVSSIVAKGVIGQELSPEEQIRLRAYFEAFFVNLEYEFGELERGYISEQEFNVEAKRARVESVRAVVEPLWAVYCETAPSEFVSFVEREIILKTR